MEKIKTTSKKFLFVLIILNIFLPSFVLAQDGGLDIPQEEKPDPVAPSSTTPAEPTPTPAPTQSGGTAPVPASTTSNPTTVPITTPTPKPKVTPAKIEISEPVLALPENLPVFKESSSAKPLLIILILAALSALGFLFFKSNTKNEDKENKKDKKCLNFKKLMEDKLNELTDLKGALANEAKILALEAMPKEVKKAHEEYERLKELYEKCIAGFSKKKVFIIHGTEGHPGENWFPWLKEKLEEKGVNSFVPQFPSPPVVPSKISQWFEVLKDYEDEIDKDSVLVGYSLGGVFVLRLLERLDHPVKEAVFVGTPIGVKPILNYDRDSGFSGFNFNWEKIKKNAENFVVFHSDDDPYVGIDNGKELAKHLGVELSFVPHAGHFNAKAGYTKFEELLKKLL